MDTFRNTFPISVTFSNGELPTAAKVSAIASQAKRGQSLIEYALGDLWNQSGDPVLTSGSLTQYALMIPSLARYIGAVRHLSPRVPYLPNIEAYSYLFQNDAGKHEAILSFPSETPGTFSWSGTGVPTTKEATIGDVRATGSWWLNPETGYCYFYDAIGSDWVLTYIPIVSGDMGSASTFNIMPDPDTDAAYTFQSVKIQYVNGTDNALGYYIYLPPRGPLYTRILDRGPQDETHSPAHALNFAASGDSGDKLFWQSSAVAASTTTVFAEHYRYNLPKIITDNWSQSGRIPAGLLHLWDPTGTGTILESVAYYAENAGTPRTWMFVAKGTALDNYLSTSTGLSLYPVASLQSSSHASGMYPSGGLRAVTVGQDLSSGVTEMFRQLLDHDHATPSSMPTKQVSHSFLSNLFDPESGTPQFDPSALTGDDHPQYLHRHGVSGLRDKYYNGMLGDLLLLSTTAGGSGDYRHLGADSCRLRFGHDTTGPSLYYDAAYQMLTLEGTGGLFLYTGDAVYRQGSQSSDAYFWVDFSGGGTGNGGNWKFTHPVGSNDTCWQSTAADTLWLETADWPQEMLLHEFQVDVYSPGVTEEIEIYFFWNEWPAGSGLERARLDQIGITGGTLNPGKVTSNKILVNNGRFLVDAVVGGTWEQVWFHHNTKLVLQIVANDVGLRFYGLRIAGQWISVNKWSSLG